LLDQCRKYFVKVVKPESIDAFLAQIKKIQNDKRKAINLLLEEIQKEINDQEKFIREQNQKVAQAEDQYNKVKDKYEVLKVAESIIPTITEQMGGERDIEMEMDAEAYALVEENMAGFGAINIRQVAGVIDQEELPRLRKLIFRGTKGKSYMYTQTIEPPEG
jgi:hypothetical protein